MMMRTQKCLIKIYLQQTIHLIVIEEIFTFATETPFSHKFLVISNYKESINFEIRIGDNLCRFSYLYCLRNKSKDDFVLNIDKVTPNNHCSNNPCK